MKVINPDLLKEMDFEALSDSLSFPKVEFDRLISLDFELMLTDSTESWAEKNPILFNEEAGVVVFGINPIAISLILERREIEQDETIRSDLKKLHDFVAKYGSEHLFEVATF